MGWADDMDRARCFCGHWLTDHDRDTLYCEVTGCRCAGYTDADDEEKGGE